MSGIAELLMNLGFNITGSDINHSQNVKRLESKGVIVSISHKAENVKDADVILCNFRPGIMDKLGLGSDALRTDNPRLIYAAITGFGTEGPEKNRPAYDPIIQAQAGFAVVQGQGKEGPELVRNLVCDKITAYTACQAVTAALYVREKTGEGQHIALSMMDAGLFFVFGDGFMHETLLDEDAEELPCLLYTSDAADE